MHGVPWVIGLKEQRRNLCNIFNFCVNFVITLKKTNRTEENRQVLFSVGTHFTKITQTISHSEVETSRINASGRLKGKTNEQK